MVDAMAASCRKGTVRECVNPFDLPGIAAGYESWYETVGRRADRLEKALLRRLIAGIPEPESVLDVGCGTGHFTRWFEEQGMRAAGLDMSPSMLAEAGSRGCAACIRGDARNLPFADDSFDLVALITVLEFVDDPFRVLVEAVRVARRALILGVLNRRSLLGLRLKAKGGPVWSCSELFAPHELVRLVRSAAAERTVKIMWRTTLWPVWPGAMFLPWGGFVGAAVRLSDPPG